MQETIIPPDSPIILMVVIGLAIFMGLVISLIQVLVF